MSYPTFYHIYKRQVDIFPKQNVSIEYEINKIPSWLAFLNINTSAYCGRISESAELKYDILVSNGGNSQDPRSTRTLRNLDCGYATPSTRRSLIFHRGREMCCMVDGGFTCATRAHRGVIPSPLKIPAPVKVCDDATWTTRWNLWCAKCRISLERGRIREIDSIEVVSTGFIPGRTCVCVQCFNSPIIAFNQT